MKVRFKKLYPNAVAPTRAHETDAGFDMTAIAYEIDDRLGIITYHTGIALEIPEGHAGFLFPRSSVYKQQLQLSNCVGIIDSGYRNEVMLKYRVEPEMTRFYAPGDRVGQLVIMPYPSIEFEEAEELSDSDRGEGGFGSTGK